MMCSSGEGGTMSPRQGENVQRPRDRTLSRLGMGSKGR